MPGRPTRTVSTITRVRAPRVGEGRGSVLHGSTAGTHEPYPCAEVRRCGHTPGVPAPACGGSMQNRGGKSPGRQSGKLLARGSEGSGAGAETGVAGEAGGGD